MSAKGNNMNYFRHFKFGFAFGKSIVSSGIDLHSIGCRNRSLWSDMLCTHVVGHTAQFCCQLWATVSRMQCIVSEVGYQESFDGLLMCLGIWWPALLHPCHLHCAHFSKFWSLGLVRGWRAGRCGHVFHWGTESKDLFLSLSICFRFLTYIKTSFF